MLQLRWNINPTRTNETRVLEGTFDPFNKRNYFHHAHAIATHDKKLQDAVQRDVPRRVVSGESPSHSDSKIAHSMLQVRWKVKPTTTSEKQMFAGTFDPMKERLNAHRDFGHHAHAIAPTKEGRARHHIEKDVPVRQFRRQRIMKDRSTTEKVRNMPAPWCKVSLRLQGVHQTAKTSRWQVPAHALQTLEQVFAVERTPSGETRKQLAANLKVTPRQVTVWFQNKRQARKGCRKTTTSSCDATAPPPPPQEPPFPVERVANDEMAERCVVLGAYDVDVWGEDEEEGEDVMCVEAQIVQ